MCKVTVLMAVYNGEVYLRDAVDSILSQTYQDFEFLIINDGSTDATREIVLSYQDPRVRLVDNPNNLGLTRSLNRGLQLATGQLIARQDADDISEPDRLAQQVTFLDNHPDIALVGTWYTRIDALGTPLGQANLPCDYPQLSWHLLFYCPFIHGSIMLRKATVSAHVGCYDEAFVYAQDYDFWTRIALALPVANQPQYLVRYRINPYSMTATYGDRVDEGLQISIANTGELLHWDVTQASVNRARFTEMYKLLFDSTARVSSSDVPHIACQILTLHDAWSRRNGIKREVGMIHRAYTCWRLASRALDMVTPSDPWTHYLIVGRLFAQAIRLHWPMLWTRQSAWLLIRLGIDLLQRVRPLP
jgi:glycosyltransferase involved in cell wall biosynthesis